MGGPDEGSRCREQGLPAREGGSKGGSNAPSSPRQREGGREAEDDGGSDLQGGYDEEGSGKGAAGDASLQDRPCSPDRRRAAAGRCGRELLATLPNESRGSARGTRGSRSAVLLRGSREKKRIGRRSNPRGAGIGLGFCGTAQNISH